MTGLENIGLSEERMKGILSQFEEFEKLPTKSPSDEILGLEHLFDKRELAALVSYVFFCLKLERCTTHEDMQMVADYALAIRNGDESVKDFDVEKVHEIMARLKDKQNQTL